MYDDVNKHDHLDDPALRETAEMLDSLGLHERNEPDGGFEGRIAASTRPGVLDSVQPSRSRHLWSSWLAVPIAASLVLGVSGLWLVRSASTTSPTQTPPLVDPVAWSEQDIDDLLFIDALVDDVIALDININTGSADEQTADELLLDVFGIEGGSS